MYDWRQMTAEDRAHALDARRARQLPWHSPPHLDLEGTHQYLISAACYEHAQVMGKSTDRMTECEESLWKACHEFSLTTHAWCVLPNHYHVLVTTEQIEELRRGLGRFHGRSSHAWNGEDSARGRKVSYNCFERPMKSRRHFLATVNYIHHNPVHHGYVQTWQDWPWSSAKEFLERVGRAQALEIWKQYPIMDYGKKWDVGEPSNQTSPLDVRTKTI
jgi:putative transposase